ncbi:hypothetical protein [Trabulsiella odontotermitis]|uniref:hypothetical protein n=1 Tax=Trabulsiella odontotermitis TaxID=379893 RepID=UPI0006763EEE|nr:hypothetical protein [Trabulsiella odontotermitis]KNC89839.1 hypothetical protein GM30_05585 [Trabulsiella odontotermitis]
MASGFGPEHPYSKSPDAIHGMAIKDIRDNGFEISCKETGIKFSILPGGSICRGIVKSLEREWYGTSKT